MSPETWQRQAGRPAGCLSPAGPRLAHLQACAEHIWSIGTIGAPPPARSPQARASTHRDCEMRTRQIGDDQQQVGDDQETLGRKPGRVPPRLRAFVLVALVLALLWPTSAQAQDPAAPVEAGARGTIGGSFLGAEVILLTEAAFGVRPVWAYAVGGGVGAIAGAIGGFASDEAGNTNLSMGFVVGAIVLAVPTTMAVLSATSYHAPTTTRQASVLTYRGTVALPNALHVSRHPTSFLAEYDGRSLAIRVPDVKLSHVYSRLELATHRAPDATEVLVPLFRMSF